MAASSTVNIVKNLKQSLSKILNSFYPFAGEIKDDFHIVCKDKGVNFTEARVKQSLYEFLRQPDDEKVRQLVSKNTGESSAGNYIMGVQVNIFNCGGIGISTSITHKIFDGHTYFLFIKAWAEATRGSTQILPPSFVASEIFPINRYLNFSWPSKFMSATCGSVTCTKRFSFDSIAIASLKDQVVAGTPTRMEATTALILKAASKASSAIKPVVSPQSHYGLISYVNFQKRASPPLPYESIGNLILEATTIFSPTSQLELSKLMGEIRKSIMQINSIESIKGEKGHEAWNEILTKLKDVMNVTDYGDRCLSVTSLLNSGIFDVDLGFGRPVWFYVMNAGYTRIVVLNDTLKGDGVEATVTLSSEEMEIFETDPELLSYVSVDSSPLQYI